MTTVFTPKAVGSTLIVPEFWEDGSWILELKKVTVEHVAKVRPIHFRDSLRPGVGIKPSVGLKPGAGSYIFVPKSVIPKPIRISVPYWADDTGFYAMRLGNRGDVEKQLREKKRRLIRSEIAGYQGPTKYETKVYVSNVRGEKRRLLDGVQSLSIGMSNFSDATWEISLACERQAGFNPWQDWILVIVEAHITGIGVKEYPMGLYRFFDDVGGIHGRVDSTWDLTGTSGEGMFLRDTTRNVLTVPSGEKILRRVRSILKGRGVPDSKINLPMKDDKVLKTAQVFDPFQDESSGSLLSVMNKLLQAGSFYSLYTENDGTFTTSLIRDIKRQPPIAFYGPPEQGGEPMLLEGITETWSAEAFANAIIVTSEDPQQEKGKGKKPIKGIAEDQKSYDELGYWVVKQVRYKTLADQDSADRLAGAQLKAARSRNLTISYTILPDPEHGPKQAVKIFHETTNGKIKGVWRTTNFGWELHPTPKTMTFEAGQGEIEEAEIV